MGSTSSRRNAAASISACTDCSGSSTRCPADQTFTDHLGRERTVAARNDINWHRTMIWVSGFFYDPKFLYTITVWSLPSTEQTLAFGLLRYVVARRLTFGAGIGPSLTARSMQGSWPFWAGSDRQMAEEFYRGGFASSFFVTGEPIDRFYYTVVDQPQPEPARHHGRQRQSRVTPTARASCGCPPRASSGRAAVSAISRNTRNSPRVSGCRPATRARAVTRPAKTRRDTRSSSSPTA